MHRCLRILAVSALSLVVPAVGAAQGSAELLPASEDVLSAYAASDPAPQNLETEPLSPPPFDRTAVFGLSGALRVAVVKCGHPIAPDLVAGAGHAGGRFEWVPLLNTKRTGLLGEPVTDQPVAPDGPGVWRLQTANSYVSAEEGLVFITPVSFAEKRGEHLNGYHIGIYPTEGSGRSDGYAPPEVFIEVTPENQDLYVSKHLRLRQFLTRDQSDVWPKYLALNLRLVDKLELVMQELNAMGVRALDLHVMSGFRTPQYNGPGGDGRARLSRHMYGDAADIWIDGDNDGNIDDLNGDGVHDIRDAELLLRAVERVEQKYPELTGGAGLYESNDYHPPYVHVDVRGNRVRW